VKFDLVLPLALDAAERLDEHAIQAHFESPEAAAERAQHEAAIADLKTRVSELRAEIRNLLTALGQRPRTAEIKGYLDDKERMVRRAHLDIEKHQRQLTALTQPPRMNGAVTKFHNTLTRLRKAPLDREAHAKLHLLFTRFDLLAEWDDEEQTWRRDCRATFDYPKLLRLSED